MSKIVVRMKSGFELAVECEEAEVKTSNISGSIIGCNFKGVKDNYPMYLDFNEIECIWSIKEGTERGEENGKNGI